MKIQITNESSKSKISTNTEHIIGTDIWSDTKNVQPDSISKTVDRYTQYLKEKDRSRKFRLIFTVSPICSNVLFNNVSEIVYREGSPTYCSFIGKNGCNNENAGGDGGVRSYLKYKGYTNHNNSNAIKNYLKRQEVISDTGYSHPECGDFTYHCGCDIFNNHIFRRKEFGVTGILGDSITGENKLVFNSIKDYARRFNGEMVTTERWYVEVSGTNKEIKGETKSMHEYTTDTLLSFRESVVKNLVEKDGWFGFINPVSIKIENCYINDSNPRYVSINKVINNREGGEFIDMYPDRTLYSFIPKKNDYLNRYEKNWEYVLTYPYKEFYDGYLVNEFIDCRPKSEEGGYGWGVRINGGDDYAGIWPMNGLRGVPYSDIYGDGYTDISDVYIRTSTRHAFQVGDVVSIDMIVMKYNEGETGYTTKDNHVDICEMHGGSIIGTNSSDLDSDYTFSLKYSTFSNFVNFIKKSGDYNDVENLNAHTHFRIRKVKDGKDCKYYFRVFKAIPNFKRSGLKIDGVADDEQVEENCMNGFENSLNKLAYEKTPYNDEKVQIVYEEDVDTTSLRDNLGRELTELYLTIVKANKGYSIWYPSLPNGTVRTNSNEIEASHCFGKVTAGIGLPIDEYNYNVHRIHNIYNTDIDKTSDTLYIQKAVKSLEEPVFASTDWKDGNPTHESIDLEEITIDGDTMLEKYKYGNGAFLGDIVELYEAGLEETVLEDVHFRFNTAQRECLAFAMNHTTNPHEYDVSGEFTDIMIDSIRKDDYDASGESFTVDTTRYNQYEKVDGNGNIAETLSYPVNLNPEGYYYKPHYKIQIKRFKDSVNEGYHTLLNYTDVKKIDNYLVFTIENAQYIYENSIIIFSSRDNEHTQSEYMVTSLYRNPDGSAKVWIKVLVDSVCTNALKLRYTLFKKNPIKPYGAIDVLDGTGKYVWRELEKDVNLSQEDEVFNSLFTNGAYYFHKNLNFFLKRQDPYGLYGLRMDNNNVTKVGNLVIGGEYKDISKIEYVEDINQSRQC